MLIQSHTRIKELVLHQHLEEAGCCTRANLTHSRGWGPFVCCAHLPPFIDSASRLGQSMAEKPQELPDTLPGGEEETTFRDDATPQEDYQLFVPARKRCCLQFVKYHLLSSSAKYPYSAQGTVPPARFQRLPRANGLHSFVQVGRDKPQSCFSVLSHFPSAPSLLPQGDPAAARSAKPMESNTSGIFQSSAQAAGC